MKKIVLLLVLAIAGVAAWFYWESKPKPDNEVAPLQAAHVSKYSDAFNTAMNDVMSQYYALSEAFVNWDSASIPSRTSSLKGQIQKLSFEELQQDSTIYQTAKSYQEEFKTAIAGIETGADITAKRQAFHGLSQHMYDLLRVIDYDHAKVYLQECPMAFNDTETGIWLSKNADIRNPYLGLYHPRYKSGMLECGEVKDSLTAN